VLRFALHVSIIVILTLLTQIGGLAYVMALAATYGLGVQRPLPNGSLRIVASGEKEDFG